MPTSYPENISRIITLIMEIMPGSILDLGAGFGKYGFLCREYLDVSQGRFRKSDWKIRIDGIEAFTPYVSELHRQIYDNLYLEDVFTAFARLEGQAYDLALVVDLLEHFEKPRAYQFLEECQRLAKIVLLSVPISYSQGAAFGNELERHRAEWTKRDFQSLKAPVILKGHRSWIVLLSRALPPHLNYLKKIKMIELLRETKWMMKNKFKFWNSKSNLR